MEGAFLISKFSIVIWIAIIMELGFVDSVSLVRGK